MLRLTSQANAFNLRSIRTVSTHDWQQRTALSTFNEQAQDLIENGYIPITDVVYQSIGENGSQRHAYTQQFGLV